MLSDMSACLACVGWQLLCTRIATRGEAHCNLAQAQESGHPSRGGARGFLNCRNVSHYDSAGLAHTPILLARLASNPKVPEAFKGPRPPAVA